VANAKRVAATGGSGLGIAPGVVGWGFDGSGRRGLRIARWFLGSRKSDERFEVVTVRDVQGVDLGAPNVAGTL